MYADLHALAVKRVTVDLWERALAQVKTWYQNHAMLRQLGKDVLFKHFKVIPSDARLFIAEERILKASTDDVQGVSVRRATEADCVKYPLLEPLPPMPVEAVTQP